MASAAQPPFDPERVALEAGEHVRLVPTVHNRLEMTAIARAVLDALDPAGVAVELPAALAEQVEIAVRRLPEISVVLAETPGGEVSAWVAAPGDPFCEAIRWALERDRPFFLIDADRPYRSRRVDRVPDPYAIWSIGPQAYLDLVAQALREAGTGVETDEEDILRERVMTHRLGVAREQLGGGLLLGFVGLAHLPGLISRGAESAAQPMIAPWRVEATVRHLHPESLTELLLDAPVLHAAWERLRGGEVPPAKAFERAVSRPTSIRRMGLTLISGAKDSDGDRARSVVDQVARHSSRPGIDGAPFPDRAKAAEVVCRVAAASYQAQTGETLERWQHRLWRDYSRRCARIQGALLPGLYEWVIAARGVADDNLAWEVFEVARAYPWQREVSELGVARVDGEMLDLGTRRVRFRRRFFRTKRRLLPVRKRPATDDPSDWLAGFDSAGICSYPREDVVIEDYGRFLQRKAISILTAENSRSEPFTGSLLDGIDVRQTLRSLHEDRIYVREMCRLPGNAGSVVVIFDRDREGVRYPFRMTWLGEHDQESDMAFYSTDPARQVVGPGIMRATYGGFLLTAPPGRLYDVWKDEEYRAAAEKRDVLLAAAIDYSQERVVVHVAADPPSARLRSYASQQGKRIVHIPIGALSPNTLRKLRVLHLLAGRDKRGIAADYIW